MLIRNATAFVGGGFLAGMEVRVHHGRIHEVGQGLSKGLYEEEVDLGGDFLLPGFVDVYVHVCRGLDAMRGEETVRAMSRELFRAGVAAFLPTITGASAQDVCTAAEGVGRVMKAPGHNAARVLGVHVETPENVPTAAAVDTRQYTMMICDGIHHHPETVRMLVGSKGAGRMVAVTGAMEDAGLADGTMCKVLENLLRWGVRPEDAVLMCTATPAEAVGEKLAGRLTAGAPAPLTRWSPAWKWKGILA